MSSKTLRFLINNFLQTDIVGQFYEPFNTQNINKSIEKSLTKWLLEKELIEEDNFYKNTIYQNLKNKGEMSTKNIRLKIFFDNYV